MSNEEYEEVRQLRILTMESLLTKRTLRTGVVMIMSEAVNHMLSHIAENCALFYLL